MQTRVECYAGYRGAETPRRFHLAGDIIEVTEVIRRWQEPDHRCFKVRGDDGAVYLLRHREAQDEWRVTPAADRR